MAQAQDIGTLTASARPMPAREAARCRICGSASVATVGRVEFYSGFPAQIWDCRDCGCRFADDPGPIHDVLHAEASSSYSVYREMAEASKRYFERGDLVKLRASLAIHRKYAFVMDAIDAGPKESAVLEVGCSRGHLTAYFILAGYDILGIDISPHAAKAAELNFGHHFALAGSSAITEREPYDVVFHIGTIGCVSDPLAFTRSLLAKLRPGGRLLFNAPNADACWLGDQLWVDGAYPPDLLTLFRKGFWTKHFSEEADVVESVEPCLPENGALIALKQLAGQKWTVPQPLPIEAGINDLREGRTKPRADPWYNVARAVRRAPSLLLRMFPRQPDPFGLFVTMTKR